MTTSSKNSPSPSEVIIPRFIAAFMSLPAHVFEQAIVMAAEPEILERVPVPWWKRAGFHLSPSGLESVIEAQGWL
jgi:hypothetical protein